MHLQKIIIIILEFLLFVHLKDSLELLCNKIFKIIRQKYQRIRKKMK